MTRPFTPDHRDTEPLDLDAVRERARVLVSQLAEREPFEWSREFRLALVRSAKDLPQLLAEVAGLRERIAAVESLCRSYTPTPPPIFSGPGLSEFGQGNNHGMRTLANAVLGTLRGEESDDDACCAECRTGGDGDG